MPPSFIMQLLTLNLLVVVCSCSLAPAAFTREAAAAAAAAATTTSCDLFVSVDGSDLSNGTSDVTPFRTIQHALESLQQVAPQASTRTVCLRGGDVFFLDSTVNISSRFSNSSSQSLTLQTNPSDLAAGKPRAVLSGGHVVGPFVPPSTPGAPWTASVPTGLQRPRILFEEAGGWLQRARMPRRDPRDSYSRFMGDASTFKYAGPLQEPTVNSTTGTTTWPDIDRFGFRFDNASFPASLEISAGDGVQVLTFQAWTAFWSDVAVFDRTNASLMFAEPLNNYYVGQWAKQGGQRFILENIRAGLDEPGEWYWDAGSNELLVLPPSSFHMGSSSSSSTSSSSSSSSDKPFSVVVPVLATLVQVSNAASGFALVDVELRHGASGETVVNTYYTTHAALSIENASDTLIQRVRVSDVGATGIMAGRDVAGLSIVDCAVERTGGEGIVVGSLDPASTQDVVVGNSLVNDTARVVLGQPGGIRLKGSANISAVGNTVGYCPYAAIMLGWQTGMNKSAAAAAWSRQEPVLKAAGNYVHNYGLGILSDFGGIYVSSSDNLCFQRTPETCWLPTHIVGNVVEEGSHYNYGCNGFYTDEQVSAIVLENNTAADVDFVGMYFHCGADNVFRNNIVSVAGRDSASLDAKVLPGMCNAGGNPTWPSMGDAIGFTFERNIVVAGQEAAASSVQYGFSDFRNSSFGNNVYWAGNNLSVQALRSQAVWPAEHGGATWEQWQTSGQDHNSLIADPLFQDWASNDFRLDPSSPALGLGFVEFQGKQVGCSNATNPYC